MKPVDSIEIIIPHCHPERLEWRPGPPDPDTPHCPGCGGPLAMAPAGPDDTERLIGTCSARQCLEEAVIFRRLEGRWIIQERRRRSAPDRIDRTNRESRVGGRTVSDPNGQPDAGGCPRPNDSA